MKTLLCFCLALGVSVKAFADEPVGDPVAIVGTWLPVKAELSGKPMPDEVLKTITLKLSSRSYEATVGGELDKGVYRISSKVNPKSITVTGMAGPNSGKTFPGIYELDGDTLRICYDLSGAGRPKEFKTIAGDQYFLVIYKRKSP